MPKSEDLGLREPARVFAELGLGDEAEVLRRDWPLSQPSFRAGKVFFLQPDYVATTCRELDMTEEVAGLFSQVLDDFAGNAALQRLAWHCRYLLFGTREGEPPDVAHWPEMPEPLGLAGRLFYALVYLGGVPFIRELNGQRGIPDQITLDTLGDIEVWIRTHRQWRGCWGFDKLGWLSLHFAGRLYSLGRFQFELTTFQHDFHVMRSREDKRVVMLAGTGMRFKSNGQFDGENGVYEAESAWTAEFSAGGPVIRGTPISPLGAAQRETVELPADRWRQVLGRGDPILGVHIPATGPMDYEDCGESFRRASEFFPRYFPRHKFRAFISNSWLFDRQLEDHLPPTSNIVRVLRELYLFPLPGASAQQTYERVFGPGIEPENAPQDTTLQRIIIRHVKSGGHWRNYGCMMLPQDLQWGSQIYRGMFG